jgi:hypothetical protein
MATEYKIDDRVEVRTPSGWKSGKVAVVHAGTIGVLRDDTKGLYTSHNPKDFRKVRTIKPAARPPRGFV